MPNGFTFAETTPQTIDLDLRPASTGQIVPYEGGRSLPSPGRSSGVGLSGHSPSHTPDIIDADWEPLGQTSRPTNPYRNAESGGRIRGGSFFPPEDPRMQPSPARVPSKNPATRAVNAANRALAGLAGVGAGVDNYRENRSIPRAVGDAIGTTVGTLAGGAAGAQVGAAAGAASTANPAGVGVGAGVGGAIGAGVGAGIGGAIGDLIGDLLDGNPKVDPGNEVRGGGEIGQTTGELANNPNLPGYFQGGQCDAVMYIVSYNYTGTRKSDPTDVISISGNVSRYGPIGGARFSGGNFQINSRGGSSQGLQPQGWFTVRSANDEIYTFSTPSLSPVPQSAGVSDNCGNNPAFLAPTKVPTTTKPMIGVPRVPVDLPFAIPDINLPGLQPTGEPSPFTNPESPDLPEFEPEKEPETLPKPTGEPFPTPTGNPDPDTSPGPSPDGGGGGGGDDTPDEPDDEEDCDVCGKLDQILDKLDEPQKCLEWQSLTVPVVSCEFNDSTQQWEAQETSVSISIIKTEDGNEAEKVENLYGEIAKANTELCLAKNKQESAGSVPEIFLAKAPSVKPQCQIQFKKVSDPTNGSRWHITIPHFDEGKKDVIELPAYTKGNYLCTLTLTDNTKIVVNAVSEAEGRRVIQECLFYVEGSYQVPIEEMKWSHIPDRKIQTVQVMPTYAKYFEGSLVDPPKWTRKL